MTGAPRARAALSPTLGKKAKKNARGQNLGPSSLHARTRSFPRPKTNLIKLAYCGEGDNRQLFLTRSVFSDGSPQAGLVHLPSRLVAHLSALAVMIIIEALYTGKLEYVILRGLSHNGSFCKHGSIYSPETGAVTCQMRPSFF